MKYARGLKLGKFASDPEWFPGQFAIALREHFRLAKYRKNLARLGVYAA